MVRISVPIAILLGLAAAIIFLGVDIRIGVRIRVSDLILLGLTPVLLFFALKEGIPRSGVAFLTAFGVYVTYAILNTLGLTGTEVAIKEAVQFTLFFALFTAMVRYLETPETTWAFVATMLAVLWILSVWNAAHHLSLGRLAGWKALGDQKLTHSVVLVMMVPLIALVSQRMRWLLLILLPVALAFLILSGERKGWAAAGIGAMAGAFFLTRPRLASVLSPNVILSLIIAMGAVALFFVLAPSVPYIDKQLTSLGHAITLAFGGEVSSQETTLSNRGRILAIQLASEQYRLNPIFGIGNENYVATVKSMAIDPALQKAAHNELLRIAAEMGTVGLALYALVYATIAGKIAQIWAMRRSLTDDQIVRAKLGTGLVVYGFIVNVFLAGGGLNTFFLVMPAALVFSVPSPHRQASQRWRPVYA